ncbi:MAG: FkbM family methyltransferase, partial [Rhodobacteraceae bacterium]|nr:FkbM family methyltransferase [Paracoccaceae bacterium]
VEERRTSRDRLQALFYALQTAIKPDMTLEIGAFAAGFSTRMARAGIPAHAFEATPYNYKRFHDSLAALGLPLTYRNCAVSDVDGEVTFEIKTKVNGRDVSPDKGNNSLLKRSEEQGEIDYETVTVPSTTLKSFLAREKLTQKSFSAWIDVEGALSKVIGGFGTSLKNCQSLIVELEELPYWQGQMLFDEAMRWFIGQGFLPVARDFESRFQFNVVFVRPAQLKRPEVRLALAQHLQRPGP